VLAVAYLHIMDLMMIALRSMVDLTNSVGRECDEKRMDLKF
jgi:hypothetical protein